VQSPLPFNLIDIDIPLALVEVEGAVIGTSSESNGTQVDSNGIVGADVESPIEAHDGKDKEELTGTSSGSDTTHIDSSRSEDNGDEVDEEEVGEDNNVEDATDVEMMRKRPRP